MTLRFAAARSAITSPLAKALSRRAPGLAANDNAAEMQDQLLHIALRHFAEHGLGAASDAYRRAQKAFFAGDREAYQWWLNVCRTLDRRMAARLEQNPRSGRPDLLP